MPTLHAIRLHWVLSVLAEHIISVRERDYSVGEREAACVWMGEQCHMYVYGRHIHSTALLETSGTGHPPLVREAPAIQLHPTVLPGLRVHSGDLLSCALRPTLLQMQQSQPCPNAPHSTPDYSLRTSGCPQSWPLCSPSSAHSSTLVDPQRSQRSWELFIV